jgi:hypothetical protein
VKRSLRQRQNGGGKAVGKNCRRNFITDTVEVSSTVSVKPLAAPDSGHYAALSGEHNVRQEIQWFNWAADGNCSNLFKVIRKAIKKEEFSRFFSDFSWPWYMPTIDEYTQLVSQSEFKAAKVWGENADRYFPDTETMIRWVDQPSLVPFLTFTPESYKANFREYVVGEMVRKTRQADGRCFETFRRINLFARK